MRRNGIVLMRTIVVALTMVVSAGACGFLGIGGISWKEEVLLHDGSKIIVKRSQTYGGRHEIGQAVPVKEHTIEFELPNSGKSYRWTSEYGEDLGRTQFNLLALHVRQGTPYLVTEPNLCLAYNKFGRPNPPYIVFMYDGKSWERISLAETPSEFKTVNLIVSNSREKDIERAASQSGHFLAAAVQQINSSLKQPYYRSIVRDALPGVETSCAPMISDGKGGWHGVGFFRDSGSYEGCHDSCVNFHIDEQHCPCKYYFSKGR